MDHTTELNSEDNSSSPSSELESQDRDPYIVFPRTPTNGTKGPLGDSQPGGLSLQATLLSDLGKIYQFYLVTPLHNRASRDKKVRFRLKHILRHSYHLHQHPELFENLGSYEDFFDEMRSLANQIIDTIEAYENEEDEELYDFGEEWHQAHPTFKGGLMPWQQFMQNGAPGTMYRQPSVDPTSESSQQIIPQGGIRILGTWKIEHSKLLDSIVKSRPKEQKPTNNKNNNEPAIREATTRSRKETLTRVEHVWEFDAH
ncbi:hypothetical protein LTR28_004707 [Elasticomyces elasticus]|nr:hypothetical protein LTR28_004707 [Elasticomyces elasticus]